MKPISAFIAIVALFLGAHYYLEYRESSNQKLYEKRLELKQKKEAEKKRFERGPFIESEKSLSEDEEAKVIVFPGHVGESYSDVFDTKCLIYINQKNNTTSMVCNGEFAPEDSSKNEK